jgi:hypothetical protein
VTIATDPPGADVAFKALDDVKGGWIQLGTSPLKGVRAPLGMLRWRITKSGFEPIEARLEVGPPAAAAGRPDINARPIRLRPLGSEFARMVFVPGDVERGGQLTDYWLDRTEVTNRDFKPFVDRGGYEDARYWTELAATGKRAGIFRDRTGRPGPSTWELGTSRIGGTRSAKPFLWKLSQWEISTAAVPSPPLASTTSDHGARSAWRVT